MVVWLLFVHLCAFFPFQAHFVSLRLTYYTFRYTIYTNTDFVLWFIFLIWAFCVCVRYYYTTTPLDYKRKSNKVELSFDIFDRNMNFLLVIIFPSDVFPNEIRPYSFMTCFRIRVDLCCKVIFRHIRVHHV